ncbi:hypothetical protein EDD21DRAFT_378797 [Dissophora ornata]|nr:hypothetical protein BGZ58_011237 [Dissophora ornata]KAI8599840.1 hypothetical protein EDD21DRAFT_378797 [Dissophora ornata]
MPEEQSNNSDVTPTKHIKSLTIEIPSYEIGPSGIPVVFNCTDEETNIRVRVVFETNFECKGRALKIDYSAIAKVSWDKSQGNNMTSTFRSKIVLAQKSYQLKLDHGPASFQQTEETEASANTATGSTTATTTTAPPPPSPMSKKIRKFVTGAELPSGPILPGKYVKEFTITLDPTFPPTCKTVSGEVTYLISAKIRRDFPSTNIVKTQQFHVFKSVIPRPIEGSGLTRWTECTNYQGLFENRMPYLCLLPPIPVYMGQTFPLLIRIDPALAQMPTEDQAREMTIESVWQKEGTERRRKRRFWTKRPPTPLDLKPEEPIRVESVCVKLREYTWHKSDGAVKFTEKQILSQNIKYGKGSSTSTSTSPPTSASVWAYQMPEESGDSSSIGSHKEFFGPCPEPGQSWKQILMLKVPEMWKMTQTVRCECLTIRHNLKILVRVKVGNHPAKELRIEMPLAVTAPRPVREPGSALDLDHYIKYLTEFP